MSGIAVVVNADGQPVDRELLAAMAEALRVRGPDTQTIWTDGGPLGLVHTLFQTTEDDGPRPQPFSLDGLTWITADARIDARGELIERLRGQGRQVERGAGDAELILHAWHVWDAACVEHLLGDFSFSVVDTSQRRVFAARDPLGVKPMFYARAADGLVLTNDLDCARVHPQISEALDDAWICDFLLFGRNTDATASVFRDIRRLPGGHRLEWTPRGLKIERYWSISIPEEVWLKHPQDYVERFQEVFQQAVGDRLRTKRVSIAMSGGLDSTAIAATAVRWAREHSSDTAFRSLTYVCDPLIPDDCERQFATEAAQFLDIPIVYIEGVQHPLFGDPWDTPDGQVPEPAQRTCLLDYTLVRSAAAHSRVILNGNGGDESMRPPRTYFPQLLAEKRYARWLADVWRYLRVLGLPPVGLRSLIRSGLRMRRSGKNQTLPRFPQWIPAEMTDRLDLRVKWDHFWNPPRSETSQTPTGFQSLATYVMQDAIKAHDASGLYGPVEFRFPWLDVRVINLCWSIPPVPMRFSKHLVRQAMRGLLPVRVLNRHKVAFASDLLVANCQQYSRSWETFVAHAPQVTEYVQGDPVSDCHRADRNSYELWLHTRPLELASWLGHYGSRRQIIPPTAPPNTYRP